MFTASNLTAVGYDKTTRSTNHSVLPVWGKLSSSLMCLSKPCFEPVIAIHFRFESSLDKLPVASDNRVHFEISIQ